MCYWLRGPGLIHIDLHLKKCHIALVLDIMLPQFRIITLLEYGKKVIKYMLLIWFNCILLFYICNSSCCCICFKHTLPIDFISSFDLVLSIPGPAKKCFQPELESPLI